MSLLLSAIDPTKAMEEDTSLDKIKGAMAAANEHHQKKYQDQPFGYVKFDLLLDGEEAPIIPWVILPDEWIPAFNGRLHTY